MAPSCLGIRGKYPRCTRKGEPLAERKAIRVLISNGPFQSLSQTDATSMARLTTILVTTSIGSAHLFGLFQGGKENKHSRGSVKNRGALDEDMQTRKGELWMEYRSLLKYLAQDEIFLVGKEKDASSSVPKISMHGHFDDQHRIDFFVEKIYFQKEKPTAATLICQSSSSSSSWINSSLITQPKRVYPALCPS